LVFHRGQRPDVVGACYLSKQDEIGVAVFKEYQGKNYGPWAIEALMLKHGKRRYLANVSPRNERSWKSFAISASSRSRSRMNAFSVVKQFEDEVAKYTGAPYCVAVNSCTMALLLACAYHKVGEVSLPKLTYNGVPMSVIHAGGRVTFRDEDWQGEYQLSPIRSGIVRGGLRAICTGRRDAMRLVPLVEDTGDTAGRGDPAR
jgi:hypothetical protein